MTKAYPKSILQKNPLMYKVKKCRDCSPLSEETGSRAAVFLVCPLPEQTKAAGLQIF